MQAYGLAPDDPTRRTVAVEPLCSWSAWRIKIRLMALARSRLMCGEAHMQEIGRVFQFVPWIDERLAKRIFIGHRREGWHFRDHADGGQLTLRRIRALTLENARKGITVNASATGYVATDLLSGVPDEVRSRLSGRSRWDGSARPRTSPAAWCSLPPMRRRGSRAPPSPSTAANSWIDMAAAPLYCNAAIYIAAHKKMRYTGVAPGPQTRRTILPGAS
jgi:hypothetical protein